MTHEINQPFYLTICDIEQSKTEQYQGTSLFPGPPRPQGCGDSSLVIAEQAISIFVLTYYIIDRGGYTIAP